MPGGVPHVPAQTAQADEYDGCFLHLTPRLAVITNVEWEHVDKFADEVWLRKRDLWSGQRRSPALVQGTSSWLSGLGCKA